MLVVGAALVDEERRVLVAQRAAPASLAGLWEFPGGKVEAGESARQALVRECREELGVAVTVGEELGEVAIAGGRLRVYLCRLSTGRPQAREHQALRWVTVDELPTLRWIAADWPLVRRLAELLSTTPVDDAR